MNLVHSLSVSSFVNSFGESNNAITAKESVSSECCYRNKSLVICRDLTN